jgi:hypothetical protein
MLKNVEKKNVEKKMLKNVKKMMKKCLKFLKKMLVKNDLARAWNET